MCLYSFLFIFLLKGYFSYIIIPFKTYHQEYKSSQNIAEDFLRENINNTIYIELEIGNPPQKIPGLIYSDEFGLFIINKKCKIPSNFKNI